MALLRKVRKRGQFLGRTGVEMEIIVENTSVKIDLPKEGAPLKQVINEVEDYLLSVGRIPTARTIDGLVFDQEMLDAELEKVLKGKERLEFGVVNVVDFVIENLSNVEPANEELLKRLSSYADQIYRNQGSEQSDELVSELTHFFEFWLKMRGLLPSYFAQVQVGDRSLSGIFDDLKAVLEEVLAAMQDDDFVLAADLIQYEVVPAIEGVQKGIPELKRVLKEAEEREDT
jgi:hypothetical protein